MVEFNSNETHNIYPNLSATPLNDQQHQFNYIKSMKLKIILLLRLKKEN